MEEAQVRTLDIFPATDCKPNFSNCNISLWLIITSLATIKARLFFETFHFFASRDVHASFTAKTISLLLLLIRLLEHYSGFAIGTFGCQRLLPSSIQCSQWIKSFHRGIKSSNLILSQKKNFWYFYSWLLQLGTEWVSIQSFGTIKRKPSNWSWFYQARSGWVVTEFSCY